MYCHKCGEAVDRDAVFCQACDAVQKAICSRCGSSVNADAAYCADCGSSAIRPAQDDLRSEAVRAGPAVGVLRCDRCKKANEPGALFCFSCGFPFDDPKNSVMATDGGQFESMAGFWVRLCAFAIDLILIGIANALVFEWTGSDTLCLILDILYWTLGVSLYEGTIGKRLLGLRVLRVDGGKCGFWQALARYLCYIISFIVLLLGFLMIGLRTDKRGLHDLICGTMVVRR